MKLKKLALALKFLTVLSLNSNVFLIVLFDCKDPSFKFSKRRNHLKPENLETPFLLSALKMPIKSVTTTKQKQNT